MESPVVVDKPPEYHGTPKEGDRGFPFDEEDAGRAWSELASRHPDIAARLRQHPATWARKRRPNSQEQAPEFNEDFGFDRFPFEDIPPEFREHFPRHWDRRFSTRDDAGPPHSPQATPHQQPPPETRQPPPQQPRNPEDCQKSATDPSVVDAEERAKRSASAPPDGHPNPNMSQNQQEPHNQDHQSGNVRHIPIFVEGRDEPVINKNFDHAANYAEPKPAYVPPPQPQPHIDREQYFADEPAFHHPPNFSRAFGTPFNKGFRQGPQPFTQQKAYPQAAFARGASPQRSQSPKPHPQEEHFVKVPVYTEQSAPKQEAPRQQQSQRQPPVPPQRQTHPPPQQSHPQPQQSPPRQEPPRPQPPSQNDPITQILAIQTDVLNLMTDVENFTGTDKKDKHYMYLDEMLTRNLIKLDNIETEGKENIRQARKEAIKCIQKCIAVLEAKAEKNNAQAQAAQDIEMKAENGEESTKDEEKAQTDQETNENNEPEMKEIAKEENKADEATTENQPPGQPEAADTRPDENASEQKVEEKPKEAKEEKKTAKKGTKNVKKRDKSKDKKEADSNKTENVENKLTENKTEEMMIDDKGDKTTQAMEVDGASPSQ